ncbi:MAG: 50S ribosomal protein L5 [Actinomycetia bacterium]|nr:50S ribosomal protein L5 [Actinomycetes bacterium]
MAAKKEAKKTSAGAPRLRTQYLEEVAPAIKKQLGITNVMEIPRLTKIVVNMGVGAAVADSKQLDAAIRDLRTITGQQPQVRRARRSIASFKLREGMAIGAKVTLRGDRMWEFLDRLIATAIPRIRDFRGFSAKSFDGRGNYSIGVTEQLIFPEVDYDSIDRTRGMDITFVTSAKDDAGARALLDGFGFPFKD